MAGLADILGGLGGAGLGATGGGTLGVGLGKKLTDDERKQKLIALVGSLLGGSLGGVAGYKLMEGLGTRHRNEMLDAELDERRARGIGLPQSALDDLDDDESKYVLGRLSKRGSTMEQSVSYELGRLLAEKSATGNCPGSKRRSKGKGRGKGYGKGKGPLGRMKYASDAVDVDVERIKNSPHVKAALDKEAWIGTALMLGSMAAPYIMDWWQQRKQAGQPGQPGVAGAGGYGANAQGYGAMPQQQAQQRPMPVRTVATAPYQFTRMASTLDGLVKSAMKKVAQGFMFPGGNVPGGAYMQPQQPAGQNLSNTMATAAMMMPAAAPAATPTPRATRGTPFNLGAAAGRAHKLRASRAAQARMLRRGGMFSGLGRGLKNFARGGSRFGALGTLGKWGLIGGLGLMAAPTIWKGLKGAWAGITGQPMNQPGAAAGGRAGQQVYSPEEMKEFTRMGVDPRQLMAAQSAAGALGAGGALRNTRFRNWMRAAELMSLPS